MSISDFIAGGGLTLVCILSLIQISKININPWTTICKVIGKALNVDVVARMDKTDATTARYRILRFDDEIRHGQRHTFEHFNQILDDINDYEAYCKAHPEYPNNKALAAIEKIKKTYEKCRDENSFL